MSAYNLIVVDVDGTVADGGHRAHLLPGDSSHCMLGLSRRAIAAYTAPELLARDAPIPEACEFLRALVLDLDMHVVFITARWESRRGATERWLRAHIFGDVTRVELELYMRPDNDDGPSVASKARNAARLIRGGAAPHVWFDDDSTMLDAAETLGFTALHAPAAFAHYDPRVLATRRRTHPHLLHSPRVAAQWGRGANDSVTR